MSWPNPTGLRLTDDELLAILGRSDPGGLGRHGRHLAQPAADVGRGPGQPRQRHRLRQAPSRQRPHPEQLAAEHAFATHLRASGLPVPAVAGARRPHGRTVLRRGDFCTRCTRWRRASTCTGTRCRGPRTSARPCPRGGRRAGPAAPGRGRVRRPARPPGGADEFLPASSPRRTRWPRWARSVAGAPASPRYLAGRDWQRATSPGSICPLIRRAAPLLAALRPQWGHGDWHPSNLTWTSAAPDARGCRGLRLRAGQQDLRRARPGPGAGARRGRAGSTCRRPARPARTSAAAARAPGRLPDGPAADRGRSPRAAAGAARRARRVRAVRGRTTSPVWPPGAIADLAYEPT